MNPAPGPLPTWRRRSGALAVSLVIHAALLAWLLTGTMAVTTAPPLPPITLELVRLPPPPVVLPPPPPPIEPRKTMKPSTPKRPSPPLPLLPREIRATAPVVAAPPTHAFTSRQDDWAAPGPAAPVAGSGNGPRRVPPGYADAVKARIVAQLEYPAHYFTKVKDTAGNIVIVRRECSIPYEITVDRKGRMISHQIESCGDAVLDAAALAALLKAGPFPPPPDAGADEYVIYGSANLFVDAHGAKSGVRR